MNYKPLPFARLAVTSGLGVLLVAGRAPAQQVLSGHVPTGAVANARAIGREQPAQPISLSLVLPLRDEAGLQTLLSRLYNPADPLYGQYLSPDEFTARFGPT